MEKLGDRDLLEQIQKYLGVGRLQQRLHRGNIDGFARHQTAYLVVEGKSCLKIVDFFEKYPLRGKKKLDFEFWKKAVLQVFSCQRHIRTKQELIQLVNIKVEMDKALNCPKRHPQGAIRALQKLQSMP